MTAPAAITPCSYCSSPYPLSELRLEVVDKKLVGIVEIEDPIFKFCEESAEALLQQLLEGGQVTLLDKDF